MTKLEWHPETFGPVSVLNVPKLEGWRLPTRAELIALYDSGDFPREMRKKRFWSSTLLATHQAFAWFVHFNDVGNSRAYHALENNYVRLVREMES